MAHSLLVEEFAGSEWDRRPHFREQRCLEVPPSACILETAAISPPPCGSNIRSKSEHNTRAGPETITKNGALRGADCGRRGLREGVLNRRANTCRKQSL